SFSTSPSSSSPSSASGMGGQTGAGGGGGAGGTGGQGVGGSGGSDPCAAGCPAGTDDIDGNPLTGMCGCEDGCHNVSATAPIDANFTDDNCDGSDGVVEQCVYVSAGQGVDTAPGTRTMPMQTIAAAIARAQQNAVPAVCLSGEIYNETVTVVSGISVYGGF